jgi:hypothetical protein
MMIALSINANLLFLGEKNVLSKTYIKWRNDWEADAYVPNVYGQDNCVVILPESENDFEQRAMAMDSKGKN